MQRSSIGIARTSARHGRNNPHANYETIRQLSHRMLVAARRLDWTALAEAESCCAALIACLNARGHADRALDAEERKEKNQIMRRILACDAEIRDLTQPELRRIEPYFGVATWVSGPDQPTR